MEAGAAADAPADAAAVCQRTRRGPRRRTAETVRAARRLRRAAEHRPASAVVGAEARQALHPEAAPELGRCDARPVPAAEGRARRGKGSGQRSSPRRTRGGGAARGFRGALRLCQGPCACVVKESGHVERPKGREGAPRARTAPGADAVCASQEKRKPISVPMLVQKRRWIASTGGPSEAHAHAAGCRVRMARRATASSAAAGLGPQRWAGAGRRRRSANHRLGESLGRVAKGRLAPGRRRGGFRTAPAARGAIQPVRRGDRRQRRPAKLEQLGDDEARKVPPRARQSRKRRGRNRVKTAAAPALESAARWWPRTRRAGRPGPRPKTPKEFQEHGAGSLRRVDVPHIFRRLGAQMRGSRRDWGSCLRRRCRREEVRASAKPPPAGGGGGSGGGGLVSPLSSVPRMRLQLHSACGCGSSSMRRGRANDPTRSGMR